jgi:uncharacterized protein YbjT (DUF2867 family)/uncharacterized protein YndB with AHSA1/START domain
MEILVTGATGYIGGRLIPRLLEAGHRVRVLVRDPGRIRGRPWAEEVEVFAGDLLEPGTLPAALRGADAAYYLVHSMYAGKDFAARDLRAARNFAGAARGVGHVIYLGGLLPAGDDVSEHLRSRAEVGAALRAALPVTELRAGPIIGSGSASFEMIRYLTERLPAMIAPRWILNEVQPIAIRDVLAYLVRALDTGPQGVVEIGADRLSFRETMRVYAAVRGLRRTIVPLPVLAPWLAARWVGLVTPIPNRLAVPLVEGVVHPVVADTRRARALWPDVDPIPYRRAVELALERIGQGEVPTRWSSALGAEEVPYEVSDWEGVIREVRTVHVRAGPERVFRVLSALGGGTGWLVWDWAWRARGLLDRLVGGPGLRRGRRDPAELLPGEAVDFWRVEAVEPPRLLRLRAEMKVPGAAWLEWTVEPEPGGGGSRLVQTATFAPRGLAGALYWYGLYPVHRPIFSDMVRAVARRAEAQARG